MSEQTATPVHHLVKITNATGINPLRLMQGKIKQDGWMQHSYGHYESRGPVCLVGAEMSVFSPHGTHRDGVPSHTQHTQHLLRERTRRLLRRAVVAEGFYDIGPVAFNDLEGTDRARVLRVMETAALMWERGEG